MRSLRILAAAALLAVVPLAASWSDTLRISQIDNTSLLVNQQVKAYLSVTDPGGVPVDGLTRDNFTVYESTGDGQWRQRDILRVEEGVNINRGINFLLIVDNSGSMYWDDTGKVRDSSDPDVWRITDAKQAVRSFLGDITNPRDRIGLITFNVDIDMRVEPTDDLVEIERALERIEKPSRPESYTELYESLYRSIDDIRALKGRKVIILLTDGWNFPKEDNPAFPDRAGIEGAIEYAQEEGISIFTIGLSDGADEESLTRISEQTGGAYFPVFDAARLASLYALIRDQVLGEYLLAYRATMAPAQQKNLRVVYESGPETRQAQRPYFAGTIFGLPWSTYRWEALAAVPAALLVLFLLSLLKSSRRTARPELTILSAGGRKKRLSVPVTGKRAVTISGQAGTDITVAGKGTEKTKISVTRKGGEVTLVSEKGEVTVNNRNVKKKTLRSGDLIKVGDTTVVFDMGEEKKAGER